MPQQGSLKRASEAFSTAALDPSNWSEALEELVRATGSYGAVIFPVQGELGPAAMTSSMEESFATYLRDGWIDHDQRYQALPAIRRNGVGTDLDFTSPELMARSTYYQDFLLPFDLQWFAGIGIIFEKNIWSLSLQRTTKQGHFTSEELLVLQKLSAQLSSVGAVSHAVAHARVEGALAAFQLSRKPIILLNGWGLVIEVNQPAEAMLKGFIQVLNRRLFCPDSKANEALQRAIGSQLTSDDPSQFGIVVSIPRLGERPLTVHALRPPNLVMDQIGDCACILTLVDHDSDQKLTAQHLRALYGLTAAEAKLATALLGGLRLETAARNLSISYETARTHLRHVFAKTGVHRQQDLISLITLVGEKLPGL